MLPTSETLLNGLIENDQSAWARLYRDYEPWINDFLSEKYGLAKADIDEVVNDTLLSLVKIMPTYKYDKEGKGAFHSLVLKIASNKTKDLFEKRRRYAERVKTFSEIPVVSGADWRREVFNIALRRVFADETIQQSTKIAFRRYVQLGEPADVVAKELGLEVNALYQIKNRIKQRISEEVKLIQEADERGYRA